MLRSVQEMNGFKIIALDGEIGDVEEFYFDDEKWAVRYIVVNTGSWLSGRQVLVSPFSVMHVDREKRRLEVALTKEQVEHSPLIDTRKPVSRQMEAAHLDFYGYPYYWGSDMLWGDSNSPVVATAPQAAAQTAAASAGAAGGGARGVTVTVRVVTEDVHLRSTQEVSNYSIAATDGEIGVVEDFIVEDETWAIRYLVVDTHKWWAGKKVMIAPQWIASIDWAQANVHVTLTREGIKQSPAYDGTAMLSRDYEEQLYGHYGQTGYWLN